MKTPRRATCGHDGCVRWAFTGSERRRVAVGWYFAHDGSVLCPDHLPDVLAEFLSGDRDAEGWRLVNG